jgi:hypothetical protein
VLVHELVMSSLAALPHLVHMMLIAASQWNASFVFSLPAKYDYYLITYNVFYKPRYI